MKLNALMVLNTIVAGVFGIAFLLVPGRVVSVYGVSADAQLAYVAQFFGGALVALAVVSWMARNAPASDARRAIVTSLAVGDSLGLLVALNGQVHAVVNALGWSTIVIYFLFALGFWTFALQKSAPPAQ